MLPAQYAWWQETLARRFVSGPANSPVVMFVDDDEVQELAARAGAQAAPLLSDAVRELVDTARGTATFRRVYQACSKWHSGSRTDPPPSLPLLAITVLAATRMRPGPNVRPNNFFRRLAEVLHPQESEERIETARATLRGSAFGEVATMWRYLDEWICEGRGERGISTIRTSHHLTRIGYPLSQALVRQSDRAMLTRFFAAARIQPGEAPEGVKLAEWLSDWRHFHSLSPAFRGALSTRELRPLLESIVAEIASEWDGDVVTPEGLRRLEVRLAVDSNRWEARWAIPAAHGVDSDSLRGSIDGQDISIKIERDGPSSVYLTDALPPVSSTALEKSFRLAGQQCTAYFAPTSIRPFVEDPDVGGWLSVSAVRPFEDHLILAAPSHAEALSRLLSSAAERGWTRVRRSLAGQIAFERVTFRDPQRLELAARSLTPELKAIAIPETSPRPRLTNGLALKSALATNVYLAGGEPDLVLPTSPRPRAIQASLDGVRQVHPFQAVGFPIELRRIGPLPAGPHELEVDDLKIEFVVRDAAPGVGNGPGRQDLGWDVRGRLSDEGIVISGAVAPDRREQDPVFGRKGKDETWIITTSGSFEPQHEPPVPPWVASRLPGISSYYFQVDAKVDSAWLVQRSGRRWSVTAINPSSPAPMRRLSPTSRSMWAAITDLQVPHAAWSSYVDAARSACGL